MGEYETAAGLFDENLRIGGPTGPHMAAFRTATYAARGEKQEARSIIQDLNRMYPEVPVENWFAKWLRDAGNLSRTMDELYRHGLPKNGD